MIVFEAAGAPLVRSGEALVAGRRLAGRLMPYGPDAGAAASRFDPVERRFVSGRREGVVQAGPWRPEAWAAAISRLPAGPVLIGPGSDAEGVRGAYRAASEAAIEAGRAAYLLDPIAEGLPSGAEGSAVVLSMWRPGPPSGAFPALRAAREAGLSAAALYPFLPGWTGEPEAVEALADAAKRDGAASLSAIAPALDGEGRRAIVEARFAEDPAAGDALFSVVHHGAWSERIGDRIAAARLAVERAGLQHLPPRPTGRGERAANAAAASRLEELAERLEADEHRAALLYGAVRWIDEAGRDLAAVSREGNFRRVFPFGDEAAGVAETALREAR